MISIQPLNVAYRTHTHRPTQNFNQKSHAQLVTEIWWQSFLNSNWADSPALERWHTDTETFVYVCIHQFQPTINVMADRTKWSIKRLR